MKQHYPLFLLFAALMTCGCESIDGISVYDAIKLTGPSPPVTLMADDSSSVVLTATLGSDAAPNKMITFKTDWGSFTGIPSSDSDGQQKLTVTASSREARVQLRASAIPKDIATLTATVDGYTDTFRIAVRTVYPDSMLIETDKVRLDTNETDTLHVLVHLFREHGRATDERLVRFYAIPDATTGASVTVTPLVYSSHGRAKAIVRSASRMVGTVKIVAQTQLSWTNTGSASVNIALQP